MWTRPNVIAPFHKVRVDVFAIPCWLAMNTPWKTTKLFQGVCEYPRASTVGRWPPAM
jgi:hypothetical protein